MILIRLLWRRCTHTLYLADNGVDYRCRLASIYENYREEYFLWEVPALLRRLFIIIASIHIYHPLARAQANTALCLIFCFLHISFLPYRDMDENRDEAISLGALCFVALCTIGLVDYTSLGSMWEIVVIVIVVVITLFLVGRMFFEKIKARLKEVMKKVRSTKIWGITNAWVESATPKIGDITMTIAKDDSIDVPPQEYFPKISPVITRRFFSNESPKQIQTNHEETEEEKIIFTSHLHQLESESPRIISLDPSMNNTAYVSQSPQKNENHPFLFDNDRSSPPYRSSPSHEKLKRTITPKKKFMTTEEPTYQPSLFTRPTRQISQNSQSSRTSQSPTQRIRPASTSQFSQQDTIRSPTHPQQHQRRHIKIVRKSVSEEDLPSV